MENTGKRFEVIATAEEDGCLHQSRSGGVWKIRAKLLRVGLMEGYVKNKWRKWRVMNNLRERLIDWMLMIGG